MSTLATCPVCGAVRACRIELARHVGARQDTLEPVEALAPELRHRWQRQQAAADAEAATRTRRKA